MIENGGQRPIEDIATAILEGNEKAESELCGRFSRGLYQMLRKRTDDPALAEDLVQETLLIVLVRLREKPLDNPLQTKAFVFSVAVKLLGAHIRKEGRRKTDADSEAIDATPSDTRSPFDLVLEREISDAVGNLIQELKMPRDREILTQFYVRGHDKAFICTAMDLDSAQFDHVMSRARKRVKQHLSQQHSVLRQALQDFFDE